MPYSKWEDWDFRLDAVDRGSQFIHLPGVAFDYRVRPDSLSVPCAHADVGRPLQAYVVRRHTELYRRRLPQLLRRVQDVIAGEADAHQRTEALATALAAAVA